MKLPNAGNAVVPAEKMIGYLLSFSHPDGRGKARFFGRFGFSAEDWQVLASALLAHAANNEVARIEKSPFGNRYVVEGIMEAPDGRRPLVRSVWFIEDGDRTPRFVTAYPLQERTK
ncbi:MAG: hypothetical protein HYR98_01920 [Nitrospirae bacterium]|nr:hypothetical protein [Nitrospirota bacterium]